MCQSAMVNCKVTTSSGTWLKIYSGLKIPPFSKINRPWLPELPGRKVGWGVSPTHSAMILWFDKKFFTNFQKIHYSKLSHSEKASKFEKISHLFWRYWVNIKISGWFFQVWCPSQKTSTLWIRKNCDKSSDNFDLLTSSKSEITRLKLYLVLEEPS